MRHAMDHSKSYYSLHEARHGPSKELLLPLWGTPWTTQRVTTLSMKHTMDHPKSHYSLHEAHHGPLKELLLSPWGTPWTTQRVITLSLWGIPWPPKLELLFSLWGTPWTTQRVITLSMRHTMDHPKSYYSLYEAHHGPPKELLLSS